MYHFLTGKIAEKTPTAAILVACLTDNKNRSASDALAIAMCHLHSSRRRAV